LWRQEKKQCKNTDKTKEKPQNRNKTKGKHIFSSVGFVCVCVCVCEPTSSLIKLCQVNVAKKAEKNKKTQQKTTTLKWRRGEKREMKIE